MKITYEVQDGYVGGSRPQVVDIDDEELNECETVEEKKELIMNYVKEHFDMNISWEITDWGEF